MKLKSFLILSLLTANFCGFSRPGGGGGGSHGGGGGFGGHGYSGGGFSGRGYYGHGGTMKLSDGEIFFLLSIICLIILSCIIYILWLQYRLRKNLSQNDAILKTRNTNDPIWNHDFMIKYSTEFYLELQAAWTNLDLKPIKHKMTISLYNSYAAVLSRFKRKKLVNKVTNVVITKSNIIYFDDYTDNNKDAFAILIEGTMKDYICKQGYKKNIPNEPFSDALVFNRIDNNWVLYEVINEPTNYQLAIPKSFIEK